MLAAKSDYDGPWLFMTIAAASSGLILAALLRGEPPQPPSLEAPAGTTDAGPAAASDADPPISSADTRPHP
jgi:hypothetical protein